MASRGYNPTMKAVGIRELKDGLSRYIRRVKDGETILVTDRGDVVAELRPFHPETVGRDLDPRLAEAVRRGEVTLGRPGRPEYPEFEPIGPPGTALRLLDEERGER